MLFFERCRNGFKSDYKKVLACCEYFAQQCAAHAIIFPRFSETIGNPLYHQIFASLEGTQYWGKCPDFTIDGAWYEHEGYDTTKDLNSLKKIKLTFFNMVTRGIKQSDRIILEDCHAGRNYARRNIFKRVHLEKQNIIEVYIRTDIGLELLYKKEAV